MTRITAAIRDRLRSRYVAVVMAVPIVALVVVLIIWVVPSLLTRHPVVTGPDRYDAMDSIRGSLITLLGGLGAVAGLAYTAKTYRLSRVEQLTGRFQEAAKQMAETDRTRRLAGIEAMAQLADEWPEQRQRCIDMLCAYVRSLDAASGDEGHYVDVHHDTRRRVIELIKLGLRRADRSSWGACHFDFTNATISSGDFSGLSMTSGTIAFDGAHFRGRSDAATEISFADATFGGKAAVSFEHATFEAHCQVQFDRAKFTGGRVSFDGAKFLGSIVSFDNAEFDAGCAVTFVDAALGMGGSVSFTHAKVRGSDAAGISFAHANFAEHELAEVNFDHADVAARLSFDGATISRLVTFTGATIAKGLSFKNARFESGGAIAFDGAVCAGSILTVDADKVDANPGITLERAVSRPTIAATQKEV